VALAANAADGRSRVRPRTTERMSKISRARKSTQKETKMSTKNDKQGRKNQWSHAGQAQRSYFEQNVLTVQLSNESRANGMLKVKEFIF
jgi:hypothetical protein